VTVADRLAIELKYSQTKEFEFSAIERRCKHHAFIGTTTWQATQERIGKLMKAGLQQDGDFERALGHNVATVN